jgi:uncharacterized protein
MEIDVLTLVILLLVVPASFIVSSAAGFGGSLLLVPALIAVTGTKEGIALAALLLAANNIAKVGVYRKTLPVRTAAIIVAAVMAGAATGAGLMVSAPEFWVTVMVIVAIVTTFAVDFLPQGVARKSWAGVLALTSGATSGFSGMSGPLKGVAIRSLGLQRQYFVGAAALVSLAGDATKAVVFARAGLLGQSDLMLAAVLIPVMIISTFVGRKINQQAGERGYAMLFWGIMLAYTTRLVLAI